MQGELNSRRKALVRRAFQQLDVDGNGVLEVSDVRQLYSADKHPDVVAGKRTRDEVLQEFLDTFEVATDKVSGVARGVVAPGVCGRGDG